MKLKSLSGLLTAMVVVMWFGACTKETTNPTAKDLSPFAQKFLGLSVAGNNASAAAKNNSINQSYNGSVNAANVMAGATSGSSDSTVVGQPWQTCAVITELDNPDGSHTTIMDYGQGCNDGYGDYKNFIHGKFIQTYRNSYENVKGVIHSAYASSYQYINYGGTSYWNNDSTVWSLNGSSSYTGTSDYDSIAQTFSGSYRNADSTEYKYGTTQYAYQTETKSQYDQSKSVTEKNNYQYTDGDNFYKSVLTIPMVTLYNCYGGNVSGGKVSVDIMWMPIPVSGHEIVTYRQDGQEGTFEVDYGNGECDTLITVTENGKTIVIDLHRDYTLLAAAAAKH